eukprot:365743-Chlamydomonas_euryale.AAC.30
MSSAQRRSTEWKCSLWQMIGCPTCRTQRTRHANVGGRCGTHMLGNGYIPPLPPASQHASLPRQHHAVEAHLSSANRRSASSSPNTMGGLILFREHVRVTKLGQQHKPCPNSR